MPKQSKPLFKVLVAFILICLLAITVYISMQINHLALISILGICMVLVWQGMKGKLPKEPLDAIKSGGHLAPFKPINRKD